MRALAAALHLLSVGSLGVFAGTMLTEGLVLVPYWRSLEPVDFYRWYAANDKRLLGFFGPVTAVAALATGAAAGAELFTGAAGGSFLLVAALLSLVFVAMFPLYFARANAAFTAASIPSDRLPGELARWAAWHHARTAVAFAALAAALAPFFS